MNLESPEQNIKKISLDRLPIGIPAEILLIDTVHASELSMLGFYTGARVSIKHVGPIGGDPVAVEVRGTLIAVHLNIAKKIQVRLI